MKTDTVSSLIKDIERLPEGTERQEMLSRLRILKEENECFEKRRHEMSEMERSQTLKRRLGGIFISLPFSCVPLYFALSGILTGESPITFHRQLKHIYWRDDPYLFSFVIGFVGFIGLIMLYLAIYSTITGKEPSGQLWPLTRRSKGRAVSGRRPPTARP